MRLLLVLLLALPAIAQTEDVSVEVTAESADPSPDRVPIGSRLVYRVAYRAAAGATIELDVPGVIDYLPTAICTAAAPIRCTVPPSDAPGSFAVATRLTEAGSVTFTARISGPHPDPAPQNNSDSVTTEVVALPSLVVTFSMVPNPVAPRTEAAINVELRNPSAIDATNVVLTVSAPEGGSVVSAISIGDNFPCEVTEGVLTCRIPRVTRARVTLVRVVFRAPDRSDGGPIRLDAEAFGDEEDFNPLDNRRAVFIRMQREYVVTSANDSGPGTLRQAMLDANAICTSVRPCSIAFAIPGEGKHVIQPLTPLPAITSAYRIDGSMQEIELDGSLQPEGPGLRLTPNCTAELNGLSITGFAGHAIDVDRVVETPGDMCANTGIPRIHIAITNNRLTRNMRGVGLRAYDATIANNVMSDNARSGLFVSDGTYVRVLDNRFENNGASGLFLHVDRADVSGNVIRGNAHWGVARTDRGNALITKNSIFENVHAAIEDDLDSMRPGLEPPRLFWAIYDVSQSQTVVRGRFDTANPALKFVVEVYASDSLSANNEPEAQRSVIEYELAPNQRDFELWLREDLRGKWITATVTRRVLDVPIPPNTTELSNAVFVAP